MATEKTRLRKAEEKYCAELHEWLTNPKNENLPNEIVEPKIMAAFDEFLQSLREDEDECAEFIAEGGIIDELDFLPLIFEHFKSRKIYEAIKSNCDVAFLHKYGTESEELEQARRDLLTYMQSRITLYEKSMLKTKTASPKTIELIKEKIMEGEFPPPPFTEETIQDIFEWFYDEEVALANAEADGQSLDQTYFNDICSAVNDLLCTDDEGPDLDYLNKHLIR